MPVLGPKAMPVARPSAEPVTQKLRTVLGDKFAIIDACGVPVGVYAATSDLLTVRTPAGYQTCADTRESDPYDAKVHSFHRTDTASNCHYARRLYAHTVSA